MNISRSFFFSVRFALLIQIRRIEISCFASIFGSGIYTQTFSQISKTIHFKCAQTKLNVYVKKCVNILSECDNNLIRPQKIKTTREKKCKHKHFCGKKDIWWRRFFSSVAFLHDITHNSQRNQQEEVSLPTLFLFLFLNLLGMSNQSKNRKLFLI